MKNNVLYYSVGPLLYCPANRENIGDSVINEQFGNHYSLALCLEDTINDYFVEDAENKLINSINHIYISYQKQPFYLPKIFVRVRNTEQITRLNRLFGESSSIITGYIIPKFSVENASDYINAIIKINEDSPVKKYMMPIYESSSIIDLRTRTEYLYSLKDSLSKVEELVLNIRVGGNDLCHIFGFRRHCDETIHDVKPISSVFSDIVTVYGSSYVISGPVWEYYNGDNWMDGLKREIKYDKLAGFTGKTVIHPNQIHVVNEAYMVSRDDFNDAQNIINWNHNSNQFVSGSEAKERMNEYKTHLNWAEKVLFLAESYGIKN